MNDWWTKQAFWWVPVLLALLGGIGWLAKDYVEASRTPGAIVTSSDTPISYVVSVRLDNHDPESAEAGWLRFEDVRPGRHQLEYSAVNRQTERRHLVVKGTRETFVPFPALSPISAPAPPPEATIYTPSARSRTHFRTNIPGGSKLRVSLLGESAKYGGIIISISTNGTSSLQWTTTDLQPGPAELVLAPNTVYGIEFDVAFIRHGEITLIASILDHEGVPIRESVVVRFSGSPETVDSQALSLHTTPS